MASVNGILEGWSSCVLWLAMDNGIRDGWPGCDWWLASANGILSGWPGWIDDWFWIMAS